MFEKWSRTSYNVVTFMFSVFLLLAYVYSKTSTYLEFNASTEDI